MESLRWRRLEPTARTRTERVRPRVRPRTRPTDRPGRARTAVAGGAAGLAIAIGLALTIGGPTSPGSATHGAAGGGVRALAALAPDVAGRAWLVHQGDDGWIWGRAGSGARTTLPRGESGFAISDRWLASGISTRAATRVLIRDLATNTVVVDRQLDFRASSAAFAGGQLLVTGYLGGIAGADGGIIAIALPGGDVQTLVASGPFPGRLGAHPSKGDFHLSASGTLAAINTCGSLGCDNVVIDVPTLATRIPRAGAPGFLRTVTDDALILTDADGAWIKGIAVGNGRERFSIAGASLMEPAGMADGRVIGNVGGGDEGWQVAAIDGRGRLAPITDRVRAPGPWVWPSVSSPTVAVLGAVPFEEALGESAGIENTLIRGSDLHQLGTFVVQPAE
jgi:hypothetical protein